MTITAPPATGRKLSLMIASDRELLTRSLAETARSQGYHIVVQEDAAGVVEALAAPGLDAIVLDTDLPGVRLTKSGAAEIGFMTAKSDEKARSAKRPAGVENIGR